MLLLATSGFGPQGAGSAAEIAHRLERLRTPLRVLYVAAHPDDENTQLLTWLARGKKVKAAYLSLTRGDGGQNLIGPEQRPLLGVIRTHELLAARRLDGAEQWFTPLRDFGYSKSAEETLEVWGPELALGEVVRVFRTFRPHVVITRFPEEGDTHGHHLASARLARQAFLAAGDPERFSEQRAAGLPAWRPRRLLYNYPHFWAARGEEPPPGPRFEVDIGGYEPWLGRSFGEISAESRSMHKSQGFGASARIGPWKETFILLEGEALEGSDPFDGLGGWETVQGAEPFRAAIEDAIAAHHGGRPGGVIPWLGRAHKAAGRIDDEILRREVQQALETLLLDAAGLVLEARVEVAQIEPGRSREVELRALSRAEGVSVVLRRVSGHGFELMPREVLEAHELWTGKVKLRSPDGAEPTRPHWLARPPEEARYVLEEPSLGLVPVAPDPVRVRFEVGVGGVGIDVPVSPTRHWVDPVLGERTEPLEVGLPVSVTPEVDVLLAPNGRAVPLDVKVRAGPEGFQGTVTLDGAAGIDPPSVALELSAGEAQSARFQVSARERAELVFRYLAGGRRPVEAWTHRVVDYAHIPRVTVREPARVRVVPVDLTAPRLVIGYVPGSGDALPDILARAGLDVRVLDGATLRAHELEGYDAILVGIRAFNVNQDLVASRDRLMDWVARGGTLVVQYNTKNWAAKLDVPVGPFPLEISRARVTDEAADVRFLKPEHPLLTWPNQITKADFEGWVQERGLYFAEKWDARYVPLFSMNDPGSEPLEGSTLVAGHGKGTYVYSALSFFRQLPAGNPGALRLLVNLLAGGAPRPPNAESGGAAASGEVAREDTE